MSSRRWTRLLFVGLLGMLLNACAWGAAAPTATTMPPTPAPSTVGCFEGLQVTAAALAGARIALEQAEERARETRNPRAGSLGELTDARLVTVASAPQSEPLQGNTAWLLAFTFTPPPGQPPTPPPGLAWRAYFLIDAQTGAYGTSCVSLLPSE